MRLTNKPLCAVVKADAYGHGAVETVNALQGIVQTFAVSLLDEALAIREAACGKEILIFTPPLRMDDTVLAVENGFSITVDGMRSAKLVLQAAQRLRKAVKVHLKVNTGMNRYGTDERGLDEVCGYLQACPLAQVVGLYSHIYGSDSQTAIRQLYAFQTARGICKRYYPNAICHFSATYGALLGDEFVLDMTRIGLGLYGYIPDGANDVSQARIDALQLKSCMRVYAEVSAAHVYLNGGAGYGTPKQPLQKGDGLQVVRVGYADGFLRGDIHGIFPNTLCMDACVRKGYANVGDSVEILTDAQEIARRTGTVSYEVLCAVNRRAERVFTYDDVTVCGRRREGYRGTEK